MNHVSFLGVPVVGDRNPGMSRKVQRPLEEFEPIIRAVLDDPTIVEFGWTQYTPYFSDGDPCVFGASGLWVRTTSDTAAKSEDEEDEAREEDDYEPDSERLNIDYNHPSLGKAEWDWVGDSWPKERVLKSYTGPDQDRFMRCKDLNAAIEAGEFDDVLLSAFGDHCKVTASRAGFSIDSYEHD